jgi:hypothetical protein
MGISKRPIPIDILIGLLLWFATSIVADVAVYLRQGPSSLWNGISFLLFNGLMCFLLITGPRWDRLTLARHVALVILAAVAVALHLARAAGWWPFAYTRL